MADKTDRIGVSGATPSATPLLVSVFVFSIFVNLLTLTGPLFMLQVYDRVLGSRSEATLVALFVLVAALYALMGLLDYARGRLMARYGARYRARLDESVFDAVVTQSFDPKNRARSATGLRSLDAVQGFLTAPIAIALFDIPWTPLFFGAIFIFHPLLGWLAVAGGGTLITITFLNNWLTRHKVVSASQASQEAHGVAEQTRLSSEIIRSQGMSRPMADRWRNQQNVALSLTLAASDWTGGFSAFTKVFRLFLQSAMLALGAWLVLRNELTAGAMIAGSIMLGRALAPIEQSIGQWELVQRAIAGRQNVKQVLGTGTMPKRTTVLPTPKAELTLSGIAVLAPGTKKPTLAGISFALLPGQVLGVIGNSGMGKSTLAKALLGVLPAAHGEICLGGATLDQYDPDQLGGLIGYLPQDVTLFTDTVAENIARMSTSPDEKIVFDAAKRANAHEMILALPEGYQTILHGSDSQLSGGQQQRLALARALWGSGATCSGRA